MNRVLFSCLSLLALLPAGAQTLESHLGRFAETSLPEKIYLHYDKAAYSPGETIWFKAYAMEGYFPAFGSKTVYVDFIADNGSVLSHVVSPLVDGTSNGQLDIPSDYKGSFLHVRAYTKWMLNSDTAFLYSKELRIVSKGSPAVKTPRPQPKPEISFFPEGGDAVAGLETRIGFKAADQWGKPVKVRGVVVDAKGTVMDSIRTQHDGMGVIRFIPVAGMTYTARWRDEKGAAHTTPLPEVKPSGVSLQVTLAENKRVILVSSNSTEATLQQLHLVGTINQRFAFQSDLAPSSGPVRRVIPTENLPSGILTITVFDSDWKAIAERITYINNGEYTFQPTMNVEHWGMGKRKRNEVRITLPDSIEVASLSISITDAQIEKDTAENIISHFLLSSEIRGRIHQPGYYFSGNTEKIQQHLDLVMMTHGWRRFRWDEIVKGKMPQVNYPRDTSYLSLSGKLFGVTRSQLTGNENIALLVKEKDSGMQMIILPIDRDGNFADPGIIIFDTVQVYYSLKSKMFSQAEARFMPLRLPTPDYRGFMKGINGPSPSYDTTGLYRHAMMAAEAVRLKGQREGKMMETVTVTAKQKTPVQQMDEKYTSGLFKGGDGYQFDLVNDPVSGSYLNILQYLQGKVAGLQISSGAEPTLSWRGGTPQVYLDENPTDIEMISNIPVADVAYIKVFRPPFMGFGGAGGAIAIYTRRGNDVQNTSTGLNTNKISGYTGIREFYSPNYDRFDPRHEEPDLRTTLYWNPSLTLGGKNRSVVLKFFNNDISTSFRVVIEGITKDGLLTHFEQIME
jgi:hypothetical protein